MSPFCAEPGDGAADVLDDRGLDALGRLVEDEQLRPRDQRPGDGELLLLAAGEVAAAAPEHVRQHREEVEDVGGDRPVGALERREPGLEVLLDRQQREDVAALRHVADAEPRALVRRHAAEA